MFRRSWSMANSTWFFSILSFIINTIQPFVLLVIPKYILDELANKRRMNVTLHYITLYAAVIILFNISNLVISYFSTVQTLKTAHRVNMDTNRKWVFMDYGNLETVMSEMSRHDVLVRWNLKLFSAQLYWALFKTRSSSPDIHT